MGWKRYTGVTAFTGMPGSGKTYSMVQAGVNAYNSGREVWCNSGFDVDFCVEHGRTFSSMDEFLEIPNGATVLWDELPLYVNARKWADFPDGMLYRLTQIRKDGLQLYYSAIHENMIDVNVRRMTYSYWRCRAITGRLFRRELWPPQEFKPEKPTRKQIVPVRMSIASHYDTAGKVAAPVAKRSKGQDVQWSMPSVMAKPATVAWSGTPGPAHDSVKGSAT